MNQAVEVLYKHEVPSVSERVPLHDRCCRITRISRESRGFPEPQALRGYKAPKGSKEGKDHKARRVILERLARLERLALKVSRVA